MPLTDESLLIPNTAGIVRGAPHAEAGRQLMDYLRQPQTIERLVSAKALEGVSSAALPAPTLKVDWDQLLSDLEPATQKLQEFFLR